MADGYVPVEQVREGQPGGLGEEERKRGYFQLSCTAVWFTPSQLLLPAAAYLAGEKMVIWGYMDYSFWKPFTEGLCPFTSKCRQ